MAVFSVIQRKNIPRTNRIDPDYYHSEFLQLAERLSQSALKERGILKRYIHSAINFGAYSLCNYIVFVETGVPYLYTQDISHNSIDFDKLHFITHNVDKLLYKSRVTDRQVLVTMAGVYLGRASVFDYGIQANSNQAIAKITVREDLLNPYFLSTFLNSLYGNFQIRRNKTGTARDNINLGQIQDLFICVPSMRFQSQIEKTVKFGKERLSDSNRLYTQAEQLLLLELGLQSWKAAHTLSYIRSRNEAAHTLRMDAEHFQPKYQAMFDRLSPKVTLVPFEKLVALSKGIEAGRSAYTDSGIPFWRVSNLTKHGLDDSNLNYVSNENYQLLRSDYEPELGEILLSKDASPGIAFYLETPIQGIISGGILRLKIVNNVPPHYLEVVLNSIFVQLQIEQSAGGSVIKHWKPSEVQKTLIPRLATGKEEEISTLIQQSHAARRQAKVLLEKAKRAVEIAIEEGEEKAITLLNE